MTKLSRLNSSLRRDLGILEIKSKFYGGVCVCLFSLMVIGRKIINSLNLLFPLRDVI